VQTDETRKSRRGKPRKQRVSLYHHERIRSAERGMEGETAEQSRCVTAEMTSELTAERRGRRRRGEAWSLVPSGCPRCPAAAREGKPETRDRRR
jgi:hypothetical protein